MDPIDDIEKRIPTGGNVSSSDISNRRKSILPVTPSRSGLGGRTSDSTAMTGSANESARMSEQEDWFHFLNLKVGKDKMQRKNSEGGNLTDESMNFSSETEEKYPIGHPKERTPG